MMIANYASKKECKASIGKYFDFIETSLFGAEYKGDGTYTVAHRPHITGKGREWFGQVTVKNDRIVSVK